MTNLERWRLYTRDLSSPDSYINFGFYYLISAALQRRVWVGPEHAPIYPNMYMILVGEPGIGKGLVIKQVNKFLNHHKQDYRKEDEMRDALAKSISNQDVLDANAELLQAAASEAAYAQGAKGTGMLGQKYQPKEKPSLIPVAADATTYEALIKALAQSYRGIQKKKIDPNTGKEVLMGIYTHSSLCFCLEELASLFRKKTEDTVNLLLQAYDCGDYTYDTKTQGKDCIKSCCLNFFAGTTPNFMQGTFDDKLLNEGFSSRTFFIFEYANRSSEFFIPELDNGQLAARDALLAHVHKLSNLYGGCTYEPAAVEFLKQWGRQFPTAQRANNSLKLKPYYSRKNIHLQKLALAIHYSENDQPYGVITLDTVMRSLDLLEEAEKKMHFALMFGDKNPLSHAAKKVEAYMKVANRPVSQVEILVEGNLFADIKKTELEEVMQYLMSAGKVEMKLVEHVSKDPAKRMHKYQLKDKKEN